MVAAAEDLAVEVVAEEEVSEVVEEDAEGSIRDLLSG